MAHGSFLLPLLVALAPDPPPIVIVDRDNIEITSSCRLNVTASPIIDADGNGVVHIKGDRIRVTFEGEPLRGAQPGQEPDSFTGTGVTISGRQLTVSGARISGYKTAIHARRANHMVIEDCDVSDNFRQRLGSTPWQEDPADWLKPHENDENQWLHKYGAGVYLELCSKATVRRVRARETQNGIVLDQSDNSRIYDNDCSFGSGWGIALWRAKGNVISRNACDFRVRGYSHGVYNRGQDSAGILLFEQSRENLITQNSATHCGDGLFGFAGREALGQTEEPFVEDWYFRRGCNNNVIAGNDFSWAAAHGAEITFSFDNQIIRNRFVGNAICGFWGGYSQRTTIAGNHFESNGDMPYGKERGGINIEHGHTNQFQQNTFLKNACGIHLWWDRDEPIMALRWANANSTASEGNTILNNTFEGDTIAIELQQVGLTTMISNEMIDVGVEVEADEVSLASLKRFKDMDLGTMPFDLPDAPGETTPVGARDGLDGREHIVMTLWGPYDGIKPLLHLVAREPDRHVYELLGPDPLENARLRTDHQIDLLREGSRIVLTTRKTGSIADYELTVTAGDATIARTETFGP